MTTFTRGRVRRRLAALIAAAAFAVVAAPQSASATFVSSANPLTMWDYGPKSTDWSLTVNGTQGTNATCAPGATGDGWTCTSATPNVIQTSAKSYRDTGGNPDFAISSDVTSIAVDLYQSGSCCEGSSATYSLQHSARNDCFGTHPQSCAYPASGQYDTYSFYGGGYYFAKGAYNYDWQDSGSCFTWCGTVASIPSDTLSSTYPYQGLDGTRNGGLHFNAIVTNPTHSPPTIVLGSPVGTTVHRVEGATDTKQSFAMTVTSPHGNNWTGNISVACPGFPTLTDNFLGQKYRSGQTAQSAPLALPPGNVTCTVTGNATDTSGTSTAAASGVSGTFTYLWNSAPSTPGTAIALGTEVHGTPLPFLIRTTDPENDNYTGLVTVYQNGSPIRTLSTTTAASGTVSAGVLTAGLPAGSYTWTASATDQWGWTSPSTAPASFTII